MKSLVIDASITIKWIFPEKTEERHLPQSLHLLKAIREGHINVVQPPHWLAEAAAVIVRLQPKIADEAMDLLNAMEFNVVNAIEIYHIACTLSEKLHHHLFDTLYHAVAIYDGNTEFITDDEHYYRKAAKQGAIIRLADFSVFDD